MTETEIYTYFQRRAVETNSLFQIELDVTSRCNANCPFCFQGNHPNTAQNEMSLTMILSLLDDLRSLGTYYIGFSGGEPFARGDFVTILAEAKRRAFRVSFVTNGMLMTKTQIDEIAQLGLDRVTVSFHSINPENYLKSFDISNISYYRNSLSNIEYMLSKKIPLGIAMTVTKYNINDIEETVRYFTSLGIHEQNINYNLLLSGKRSVSELRPSEEDIRNNAKYLSQKFIPDSNGNRTRLMCGAGTLSCSIDSLGNVFPCTFFNSPVGNLHESNIQSIWENSHYLKILRSFKETMFEKCKGCDIIGSCGLCLADNLNETGNIFNPSENFCQSRKARVGIHD